MQQESLKNTGLTYNGIPTFVIADAMDGIKGLGNAVVPQVAEWIGKRIIATQRGAALGREREMNEGLSALTESDAGMVVDSGDELSGEVFLRE